jgi:hypothetical protein
VDFANRQTIFNPQTLTINSLYDSIAHIERFRGIRFSYGFNGLLLRCSDLDDFITVIQTPHKVVAIDFVMTVYALTKRENVTMGLTSPQWVANLSSSCQITEIMIYRKR